MADPTPEIGFKPKEVLHFSEGTVPLANKIITAEEQTHIEELKERRTKGAKGKEILARASEAGQEVRFSSNEAASLQAQFGGGKAETRPGPPPSAELDPAIATPEEKFSFENAKNAIEDANAYIQYTSILAEAITSRKKVDQIIADRVSRGETGILHKTAFYQARERALNALTSTSAVQQLFPELNSLPVKERQQYLEALIAKDPYMRSRVAQTLKDVATTAQTLPAVETDTELKTLETQQRNLINTIDANGVQLIQSIMADGFNLSPAEQLEIAQLMQTAASPDQILNRVRELTINKVPHATDFARLPELESQVNEAFNKLKEIRPPASLPKGATPSPTTIDVSAFEKKWQDLSEEYDRIDKLKNDNRADYDRFRYLDTRYSLSPTETSPVAARFAEIISASSALQQTNAAIAEKRAHPNKNEATSRNLRLIQEAALIDTLDNALSEAIIDTLTKRYDEMEILEGARQRDVIEKNGTEDDKAIRKAMENNWITYNAVNREKVVHDARITHDKRMLVYEGEDGIRRLMIRDLGLVDASGNVIEFATVDLSTLSDENKRRLDAVYEKHAGSYRDKLFADMFASRTLGSKFKDRLPGTDKMGLKPHEWQLLEQKFSGKLAEALGRSKEAQSVIKNLEAQGIKPDFKMKWLLYVLLGLGGVALGGAGLGAVGLTPSLMG